MISDKNSIFPRKISREHSKLFTKCICAKRLTGDYKCGFRYVNKLLFFHCSHKHHLALLTSEAIRFHDEFMKNEWLMTIKVIIRFPKMG